MQSSELHGCESNLLLCLFWSLFVALAHIMAGYDFVICLIGCSSPRAKPRFSVIDKTQGLLILHQSFPLAGPQLGCACVKLSVYISSQCRGESIVPAACMS